MDRIVPDTNVLVPVTISDQGSPDKFFRAWKNGTIEIATSPVLLEEFRTFISRPRIKKYQWMNSEEINELISLLLKGAVLGPGEKTVEVIEEDPDDDYVLSAAIETEADYIISGDRHLLDVNIFRGIDILSPSEFTTLLKEETDAL